MTEPGSLPIKDFKPQEFYKFNYDENWAIWKYAGDRKGIFITSNREDYKSGDVVTIDEQFGKWEVLGLEERVKLL